MKKTFLSTAIVSVLALSSASVLAHEAGDILLRVGLTTVAPDASSSPILAGGADLGQSLGLGSLLVDVDNNTQLGLNFAYFLTDNINVEVLAATPFKHDIEFLGTKLGETKHLPPTVTVNYFFADPSAKFQPYVGAGLNYTIFFSEDFDQGAVETVQTVTEGAVISNLDLDASFGLSLQAGADYEVSDGIYINASIRYIDIDTEASFDINGAAGGSISTVEIDPWVYTLSVGYKF
ncbi:outer membrane beta-barrel protein [Glaciecola sp. XM2]|jgi:outer membrane protein|uniref:OmpW family outer membrane protein n=1 Tax=Glaciecola sp. XM2 TaxID=1914931 RepID=UPI001BDF4372|nr:OmpW family outer membrane protein [Glaciecola sp. XM2]MBT1451613.1 outer membrane beta-barrel protein [Glaciecola sp. XM2]